MESIIWIMLMVFLVAVLFFVFCFKIYTYQKSGEPDPLLSIQGGGLTNDNSLFAIAAQQGLTDTPVQSLTAYGQFMLTNAQTKQDVRIQIDKFESDTDAAYIEGVDSMNKRLRVIFSKPNKFIIQSLDAPQVPIVNTQFNQNSTLQILKS